MDYDIKKKKIDKQEELSKHKPDKEEEEANKKKLPSKDKHDKVEEANKKKLPSKDKPTKKEITKKEPSKDKPTKKEITKKEPSKKKTSEKEPSEEEISKEKLIKKTAKYFLFKCGPTGSGKSIIEDKIDEYLNSKSEIKGNLFKNKDTINLSIDDLVEKNPYFKENVDLLFKNIFDKNKIKIQKQIKKEQIIEGKSRKDKIKSLEMTLNDNLIKIIMKEFENPSRIIIDELNLIYKNARSNTNCINGQTNKRITRQVAKDIKDNCENIRNNLLEEALNNNKNIVFERTGIDFPKKLFDKYPKIVNEYNIIFCWSVVDICELLHRNSERVIKKLENYMKIKNNSPIKYDNLDDFLKAEVLPIPRLPDIDEINYKQNLQKIINTFNLCFYNKKNYRQIVIDNNFNPIIIYDNKYHLLSNIKSNPLNRYNIENKC